MWRLNTQNVGEFQERDHGHWFTYRLTTNEWALKHGLTHEVDVLDGVRFARILKTRAHVAVDEHPDGSAATEVWYLRRHTIFTPKDPQ